MNNSQNFEIKLVFTAIKRKKNLLNANNSRHMQHNLVVFWFMKFIAGTQYCKSIDVVWRTSSVFTNLLLIFYISISPKLSVYAEKQLWLNITWQILLAPASVANPGMEKNFLHILYIRRKTRMSTWEYCCRSPLRCNYLLARLTIVPFFIANLLPLFLFTN